MTNRARAIVEVLRSALASLDSLSPAEQDQIVATLVADLRARRPVAVGLAIVQDLDRPIGEAAITERPTIETRKLTGRVGYDDAAAFLGIKVGTLRSMVSRKQVPHIRLSARLVVFDTNELQSHIAAHRVAAGGGR